MSLYLREVTDDDLPLIALWLHADHVRSAWGDPDANFHLLNEPPARAGFRRDREFDHVPDGRYVLRVCHRQAV